MGISDDVRIWETSFQVLKPLASMPVPCEIVLEKELSPAYHLEGRGRPATHTQIVCTVSGEGRFRDKNIIHRLTPGMAFMSMLGDPDTAYYYPENGTEPWIFIWVSFDGDCAVKIIRELGERYGKVVSLPLDSGFVKHLESYRNRRESIQFLTPTEGAKIVHDILASLGDTIEKPQIESRQGELVQSARRLIGSGTGYLFNTRDIAVKLHVSREHLSRVFKEQTGTSIGEFIMEERMRLARRLLRDPSLTCKEIAERTGFHSANSFSRAFREKFHVSPSKYITAD